MDADQPTATPETASLTDTRDRLSEIVDHVATSGDVFTITKRGRPLAVVLGHDDYDALIETLNILSDDETMAAIAEARAEAPNFDAASS